MSCWDVVRVYIWWLPEISTIGHIAQDRSDLPGPQKQYVA